MFAGLITIFVAVIIAAIAVDVAIAVIIASLVTYRSHFQRPHLRN